MAMNARIVSASNTSHSAVRVGVARQTQCRLLDPKESTRFGPKCGENQRIRRSSTFEGGLWFGTQSRSQSALLAAPSTTTTTTPMEAEYSRMITQELNLLCYQLNFDSQLQRALNYEDFESAALIRSKRQEVDEILEALQSMKGEGAGTRSGAHTEEAGLASEGLRLRSEMQRAVDEERYTDAAAVRDRLRTLQERMEELTAAAAALEAPAPRNLRLGQRVIHMNHGYRGVICGWDTTCCEMEDWQGEAGVASLERGSQQAFYHVLVDRRDWTAVEGTHPLTYIAEELLCGPEEGKTWLEEYGDDSFSHPYSSLLFLGTDHAGDMLPSRALREKYSAERRDVGPSDGEDEEEDDEDDQSPGGGILFPFGQ